MVLVTLSIAAYVLRNSSESCNSFHLSEEYEIDGRVQDENRGNAHHKHHQQHHVKDIWSQPILEVTSIQYSSVSRSSISLKLLSKLEHRRRNHHRHQEQQSDGDPSNPGRHDHHGMTDSEEPLTRNPCYHEHRADNCEVSQELRHLTQRSTVNCPIDLSEACVRNDED